MRLRTFSAVLSFIAMANKNKELFVPISGTDKKNVALSPQPVRNSFEKLFVCFYHALSVKNANKKRINQCTDNNVQVFRVNGWRRLRRFKRRHAMRELSLWNIVERVLINLTLAVSLISFCGADDMLILDHKCLVSASVGDAEVTAHWASPAGS